MTVYADVIFAVNTAVNYLLLLLGGRLTGFPTRPLRALLGAAVGGGYAVCVLLPALAFMGSWWGKIGCFLLMCIMAYGIRRCAVRPSAVSLLCGAALAGVVFLLTQVCSVGFVTFQGHVYYPMSAKMLVVLSGGFYFAAAMLMAGSLKHRAGETVTLQLRLGQRQVAVTALYDTGNTLRDPFGGRPVVVAQWQRGMELLGVSATKDRMQDASAAVQEIHRQRPDVAVRLVPYRAVGTEGGLLPAVPCRVKVGNQRERDVLLALSPNPVSDGGGYEALIGGVLF